MIYLYDAPARSFCRKDFNKFHVISCLWYGGARGVFGGKLEQKFIASDFSNVNFSFLSHCDDDSFRESGCGGFGDEKWGKLLLKQSLWRRRPNAWLSITELSTVRELINAESADVWKRSSWAAITVAGESNGTIQTAPLIFQATLDDCELLSYFNANKLFIVAVCSLSLPEHSLRRIFTIFYSISCNFLRLSSPPTKAGRAKKNNERK